MSTIRVLALLVVATAVIASYSRPLGAQSPPTANKPDSVSIHVSLTKRTYAVGEKPIAVLTIKNISSNEVMYPNDLYHVWVHVTGKDADPPKTELHRHLLGDFRPGDSSIGLQGGSVVGQSIPPGSQLSLKYDLTRYYDLSKPDDYSVYLEIYDPAGPKNGSGHWLRTNTAKFEIQAPIQ